MKDQTPRGGRIINNGSISAHAPRPFSSAYTSTKHAITGLTKASNLDGRMYDIAVGQVDIGNAATPMTDRMVAGPGVMQPDGTMKHEPRMDAKAVGDAVAYMAGLPLDANVLFMTVMATKMPFVGTGLVSLPGSPLPFLSSTSLLLLLTHAFTASFPPPFPLTHCTADAWIARYACRRTIRWAGIAGLRCACLCKLADDRRDIRSPN